MISKKLSSLALILLLAPMAFGAGNAVKTVQATKVTNGSGVVNVNSSGSVTIPNQTGNALISGNASIVNADISGSAAISRSKVATGTANHVLINDGSGVVSSEANLAISRGGTGAGTKSAAFDALSPNTTKGDITVHNGTNNVRQAVGSFGQVLTADSSQATGVKWSTPSKGLKNYIVTNADIEQNATTGYSLGHVALTNGLPSGSPTFGSGASGTLSIAATSTAPISDSYSLNYIQASVATTAGDFVATDAFTIDPEGQAKALQFKISYQYVSGTIGTNAFSGTSSNYFGVALYDVTNSAFIPCAGAFNVVQSSGVGVASGVCQTNYNTASARLLFYNVSASSGAITMKLDNFFLGPQISSSGVPATDWTDGGAITIGATTTAPTKGTTATDKVRWRRSGDSIDLEFEYRQTAASASNGSGSYLLSIPTAAGCTIDFNKFTDPSSTVRKQTVIGHGMVADNTTAAVLEFVPYSNTQIAANFVYNGGGSSFWGSATGFAMFTASAGEFSGSIRGLPCVGWSSNTAQSADSDNRIISAIYNGTPTGTLSGSFNPVTYPTKVEDTAAMCSGNTCTIPVTGKYDIFASAGVGAAYTAGARAMLAIYVNGSEAVRGQQFRAQTSITNTFITSVGVDGYPLKAGDTVQIEVFSDATTPSWGSESALFSIHKVSGSAVVQATDGVNARIYLGTNQTGVANSSDVQVLLDSAQYDSHGKWASNAYVIPVPGKYSFCLQLATGTSSTNGVALAYRKNGGSSVYMGGGSLAATRTQGCATDSFNAGDSLTFYINQSSGGTITINSGNTNSYVMINRVGN